MARLISVLKSPARALLIGLLKGYRFAISPIYGQVCRYHPSCSAYALEAVTRFGALRGGWLATRRIGHCHPWAAGGDDAGPAAFNWPTAHSAHSRLALPGSASSFTPATPP